MNFAVLLIIAALADVNHSSLAMSVGQSGRTWNDLEEDYPYVPQELVQQVRKRDLRQRTFSTCLQCTARLCTRQEDALELILLLERNFEEVEREAKAVKDILHSAEDGGGKKRLMRLT